MKKKSHKDIDVAETMVQIQQQLASLDKKLEAFINKSLADIAQALAAQKNAIAPRPVPTLQVRPHQHQSHESNRRPMFAVICFECGKDCEIPFKPAQGRPVYCPECFAKRKAAKVNNFQAPPTPIKTPEPSAQTKKKAPPAKKSTTKQEVTAKKMKKK